MSNLQSILNSLHCRAVYVTGSSVLPFIEHPRDVEYYAVFETKEEAVKAPHIHNVHKIVVGDTPKVQSYSYLFYYLNHTSKYVGKKYHFNEVSIEELVEYKPYFIKLFNLNPTRKEKVWYRIAIIDAIAQYGYNDIPKEVIDLINELHDMTITYEEYERRLKYVR